MTDAVIETDPIPDTLHSLRADLAARSGPMDVVNYHELAVRVAALGARAERDVAGGLLFEAARAGGMARIRLSTVRADISDVLRSRGVVPDLGHNIAEEVLREDFSNGSHLMFLEDGAFWIYNGRVWARTSPARVHADVVSRIEYQVRERGLDLGAKPVAAVADEAVRLIRAKATRTDDPLSLRQRPKPILNFRNGELHLDKMEFRSHDPASYLIHVLATDYDPSARASVFEAATLDMMGGDPDTHRHLLEVLASILMPQKRHAIIVLFIGPGADGKTTLAQTLLGILGSAGRSGRIGDLSASRFASGQLVGKSAFIDDDVDHNVELPVADLKRFSEPKLVSGEIKGGEHFDFWAETSLVLLANAFPPVRDTSYGFSRRVIVIPFTQQFHDRHQAVRIMRERGAASSEEAGIKVADHTLRDQLAPESAGIVNLLIEAWQRLRDRGGFDEPAPCVDARERWREAADSVVRFLREAYEPAADARVKMMDFEAAYRDWCQRHRVKAKGQPKIREALENAGVEIVRPQGTNHIKGWRPARGSVGSVGEFLRTRCQTTDRSVSVKFTKITEAYGAWCRELECEPASNERLRMCLNSYGFRIGGSAVDRRVFGIKLLRVNGRVRAAKANIRGNHT